MDMQTLQCPEVSHAVIVCMHSDTMLVYSYSPQYKAIETGEAGSNA